MSSSRLEHTADTSNRLNTISLSTVKARFMSELTPLLNPPSESFGSLHDCLDLLCPNAQPLLTMLVSSLLSENTQLAGFLINTFVQVVPPLKAATFSMSTDRPVPSSTRPCPSSTTRSTVLQAAGLVHIWSVCSNHAR
jgi:hypothetical protein